MSNIDDPDKKPPPQPTVAWDPSDVPGLEDDPVDAVESTSPAATPPPAPTAPATPPVAPPATPPVAPPAVTPPAASGSAPTQRLPVQEDVPIPEEAPSPPAAAPSPSAAPPSAPDPNATVMFSAEDVARLVEEEAAAIEVAVEEEDRLIGTLIRNKWKVLKRLGAGSFGTVYKVEDVKGGWIEALKILGVDRLAGAEADEMRGRFLREAQIMKRLGKDSKHIVGMSTYEEDIESGLIYFLMEFVEGRSMADALSEDGPFTVERTIRLALQACDALMAAHEGPEPVVHRDIKLENLMLTKDRAGDETVKVLDFGIAKIAEREADSRLTTVGTLGTPGYAAPEQLRAEAVDGRTDLFAFGVILYALLTGRDPWLGNLAHEPTHQIYELMVATDRAEVRPIAESGVSIPPAMVNIVMKLLRRDPAQRFQSARELAEALKRVSDGVAATDSGSLRVITDDEGVKVEIRDGRTLVAEGPTPCTANGIPSGTYSVTVRDPRYEAGETSVVLGAGAMQDVTVVTTKRATATTQRPQASKKKGGAGKLVAAIIVLVAGAATAYAQPWGRTLDTNGFWARVTQGSISSVWLTDGGAEGGIQVVPIAAAASMLTPFYVPVPEGEVPDFVARLHSEGITVDASWELRRLTDLAVDAQEKNLYFDFEGGDVRSYALRLAELVPDSPEAASFLLKVGERMAWDAEAALQEGPPERARELIEECLELVPGHPRCVELSESL